MKHVAGLPTRQWSGFEIGFWLLPLIAFFLFPKYLTLGSQILIAGLFALSLDLILGYARIISLGHAAFLATGKHDLRGRKRPPGLQDDLVAFKQHWRLSPGQAAELGACASIERLCRQELSDCRWWGRRVCSAF